MAEDSNPSLASRKNFGPLLEEFSGYSTFHGLHYVIGNGRAIRRRLIWLMFILIGISFLTMQLVVSYKKLKSYEHVISKEINPSQKLTFPAVTICNVNMMQKFKILGTDAQLYLDQLNVYKMLAHPQEYANKTLNSSFDIEKAVRKYGHSAHDMFRRSYWDGVPVSYLNFTTSFSYLVSIVIKDI